MKKSLLYFFMILFLQNLSVIASDRFDPESVKFSKMETLKTWIAPMYQDDLELCSKIQNYVALEVPQNPKRLFPVYMPGFGRSFDVLEESQLRFLQDVNEKSQSKSMPRVFEIGAAEGRVAWKIPYALGGKGIVYINELENCALELLPSRLKARLTNNLEGIIEILPGSCFDLSKDFLDSVWGKIDVLYVQNVEHFFNPEQHQEFLKLVSNLLSQDGCAYLTANTLPSNDIRLSEGWNMTDEDYPLGKTYPYFESIKSGEEIDFNYFTPDVYRNAVEKTVGLRIVETFLMNHKGERQSSVDEQSRFVTAIIKKIASLQKFLSPDIS